MILQKRETWGDEMLADMEQYYWDLNPSKQNILSILQRIQEVDKVVWDGGGSREGYYRNVRLARMRCWQVWSNIIGT